MQHAAPVRARQNVQQLKRGPPRVLLAKHPTNTPSHEVKRLPNEQIHHEEELALRPFADLVDWHNSGVC
jgi:hypothetical protein